MSKVYLLSMFRNSTPYMARYMDQFVLLRNLLERRGDELHAIWTEGDSVDQTWMMLHKNMWHYGLNATILQMPHGGPVTHFEDPDRFARLDKIWRAMFRRIPEEADTVAIVESDLIWNPCDLVTLIDYSTCGDIVTPITWLGPLFYDTWACRRNGVRFGNEQPIHPDLNGADKWLELDSNGSCLVMPAHVARENKTTPEDELVGFCNSATANGVRVWLTPEINIEHPMSLDRLFQRVTGQVDA